LALGRKADGQERKIHVLGALCEKLMATTRKNVTLRSSMQEEMDVIGRENKDLTKKLSRSEADNVGLSAR
jgi:hypothetical protein